MSTNQVQLSKPPTPVLKTFAKGGQRLLLSKSMEKTFNRMRKPGARSAFVEAEVVTSLAHQIRVLRLQRNWTQHDLAKKMGSTQAVVSRLEDPSYGKASIQVLLKLGAIFDVALNVRFGSFVSFFQEAMKPSRAALEVPSFEEEADCVGFFEHRQDVASPPQVGVSYVSMDSPLPKTAYFQLLGGRQSIYSDMLSAGSKLPEFRNAFFVSANNGT